MIDDPTDVLPPDSPAALSLERGRSRRAAVPRRSHAAWSGGRRPRCHRHAGGIQ